VRLARGKFTELKRRAEHRAGARKVFLRHGSRKRPGTQIEDPRWFETGAVRTGGAAGTAPAGGQLELGM